MTRLTWNSASSMRAAEEVVEEWSDMVIAVYVAFGFTNTLVGLLCRPGLWVTH